MKTLYVFADFDWLKEPMLVGELGYESLCGSDSYAFTFDGGWLGRYGSLFLSADINNYTGRQYTQPGHDIFGCFGDALPDRWGRMLQNRREQILAVEEQRPARKLSSFDFLCGIDDFSRMGGFRFKESLDGDFINNSDVLLVPPLTDIRSLAVASREIEGSEEKSVLPEKQWVQQLLCPGSSLGGARPKAGVRDTDGLLYVAKFPSRNDDYDVSVWEHLAHQLAKKAGVTAAETSVVPTGGKYHALLSKRFDRTVDGRRIHFASAMTLLGLTDGADAKSGNGYLDIVDFIIQGCCRVDENLRQLYRRVAFNVAIGNSDDHFRNHGFLLTPKGWTLSPAYDMNPTNSGYQSLLISSSTNKADLELLLEASEEYLIDYAEAVQIIGEVKEAVAGWRSVAKKLGVNKREVDLFEPVFDRVLS